MKISDDQNMVEIRVNLEFVEAIGESCAKCYYGRNRDLNCTNTELPCVGIERKDGKDGYFKEVIDGS